MRSVVAVALTCAFLAPAVSAQKKPTVPAQSGSPVKVTTGAPSEAPPNLASAKRVKRDEALKLVKTGKAVFVDVRSKESFEAGHIKGALSIPGSQLIARIKELPAGKMIIAYCA